MTFPAEFCERTRRLMGKEFELLEEALQLEAPVSIRVNATKGIVGLPAGEQVAWCDTGYYLPERISFTFDPLFHAGAYYVQEASSMFLEQAVKAHVHEPVKCLDLCAAPGGKSTHLCSILPEGSLLVCNEVIRSRSYILAENVAKWGNPNTIVCNNDPEALGKLTHFFDLVIADLPCSGEGMFRKDIGAAKEWSEANVNLCAARQRRIIHDIWNALKPGGLLVYSTCTYNIEENEENIHYIKEELGADILPIPSKEEWNISGPFRYNDPVYRFFPHKTKGEGFFLAVLRKADGSIHITKQPKEKTTTPTSPPTAANHWLRYPDNFRIELTNQSIQAIPLIHTGSVSFLTRQLHVLSSGISMGEVKGKDLIPAHFLALSTELSHSAFPTIEVSREEAIRYLQKEAIPLSGEKGYQLLTYERMPLGYVKQLGNRANNLYPQEWRIRSNKIPGERTDIVLTPGTVFSV
jgi:16S rRNA C967 or C1407 C5-methylase (RsmB/RsmF family)/NOL1/NOP2/fmu family ribosome biogenesis protein